MTSLAGAVTAIVTLIIVGLIFGLLWWLIDYCALPAPFAKVARVVLALVAVLFVIGVLLSFVGVRIFAP